MCGYFRISARRLENVVFPQQLVPTTITRSSWEVIRSAYRDPDPLSHPWLAASYMPALMRARLAHACQKAPWDRSSVPEFRRASPLGPHGGRCQKDCQSRPSGLGDRHTWAWDTVFRRCRRESSPECQSSVQFGKAIPAPDSSHLPAPADGPKAPPIEQGLCISAHHAVRCRPQSGAPTRHKVGPIGGYLLW